MPEEVNQDKEVERLAEPFPILGRFIEENEPRPNRDEYLITGRQEKNKSFLKSDKTREIINSLDLIKYSLNSKKENMNPRILEERRVNERVDDFIREELARQQIERDVRPIVPQMPLESQNTRGNFLSSTGLSASVSVGYRRSLTVNGEKVILADYNDIHFTPEGRGHFDRSKMTKSLASGIQGVAELIDAVDQGRFKAAQVFVGMTNINMALIAQRLGFVIVDECRTADGNINKQLRVFTVVGKLDDIRSRVEEFKRSGTPQRLAQRTHRPQQLKPALAGR